MIGLRQKRIFSNLKLQLLKDQNNVDRRINSYLVKFKAQRKKINDFKMS